MTHKEKTCNRCGKKYLTNPKYSSSQIAASKFCSSECQHRGHEFGGVLLKSPYNRIHLWLKNNFVKKSICEHCSLYKKTQFALKKGKEYEKKRDNFLELCAKCHHAYDRQADKWSKQVYRINSNGSRTLFKSITEASRSIGLANSNISGVLIGRQLTAGGYKWEYAEKS